MSFLRKKDGTFDAMLLAVMATLGIVLFKVLCIGVTIGKVTLGSIDGGVIAALLGPTFSAYCARKWTEAHYGKDEAPPAAPSGSSER